PGLLEYAGLARPVAGQLVTLTRVAANKTLHGNHADYFSGTLKIPATGNIAIAVKGEHQAAAKPFQASFKNFSNVPLTGAYFPSYGVTNLGDPIPFGTVKPGESAKSETLPKQNGKDPTDYVVSAAGSAATQTTLAFLGTVEDAPGISELE